MQQIPMIGDSAYSTTRLQSLKISSLVVKSIEDMLRKFENNLA
jgi:hypothetical protein